MYGIAGAIYCYLTINLLLTISGTVMIGIGSHFVDQKCDDCSVTIVNNVATIKYNNISQILDIDFKNDQTVDCIYSNNQIQITNECNQIVGIILLAIGIPIIVVVNIMHFIIPT